jgi:hypothetical protein
VSCCRKCETEDCSAEGAPGETRMIGALDGGTGGSVGEPPVGLRVPGLEDVVRTNGDTIGNEITIGRDVRPSGRR